MCLVLLKHVLQRILPRRICLMYCLTRLILKMALPPLIFLQEQEALVSRGCDKVISVEKDSQHYAFICKVMQEVKTDKCFPIRGDVFKYIENSSEKFDFIFADPPYELKGLETISQLIFEKGLLKEDGLFVLEHGKTNNFEDDPHFVERRVYGSVNFSFFRLDNK
jgi:16S rRNA (guanine966-N2)-methyltransferase